MERYRKLYARNRDWVDQLTEQDPEYFARRRERQEPNFLVIGCADSRVPIETLTDTEPGEMFIHRNIANQVFLGDLNALSVVQFAVDVLEVKHILVLGHYGCGGIKAAQAGHGHGLVDHWLSNIRTIARIHADELASIADPEHRLNRLTELNVLEQVYNLSLTPVLRDAWDRGPQPILHGVTYDMGTGLLHELISGVDSREKAEPLLKVRG